MVLGEDGEEERRGPGGQVVGVVEGKRAYDKGEDERWEQGRIGQGRDDEGLRAGESYVS